MMLPDCMNLKQWATYKRARIGQFDYVISPLWYKLYNLAIKILKKIII